MHTRLPAKLIAQRRGFTIKELLVVVLLAGVAAAAVTPVADAAKERDRRIRCATNLRMIGQGIQMYANENKGNFPRTRFNPRNSERVALFTNWDAKDPFGEDGPQSNDVTAALFLLLRTQDLTEDVFLCPSDPAARPINFGQPVEDGAGGAGEGEGVVDPVATLEPVANVPPGYRTPATRPASRGAGEIPGWPPKPVGNPVAKTAADISNFPSPINLSYSYVNPYPSQPAMDAGFKLNYTLTSDFAVAGDLNPGGEALAAMSPRQMPAPGPAQRGAPRFTDAMRKANSPNHGGFGQNVLYADGHVEWQPTPFCGMQRDKPKARDNVYTRHQPEKGGDLILGPSMDPLDSVPLPTSASRAAQPAGKARL